MKKNLLIASILGSICLVCALLIALIDIATKNKIEQNTRETELATIKEIFENYDDEKSLQLEAKGNINKKLKAYDKDSNELGYLYNVSGKNAYGSISLMIAIVNDELYQVEILENTQSFASTVYSYFKTTYPSSKDTAVHVGAYSSTDVTIGSLTAGEVENIDVSCGATYGAKLIRDLVLEALEDER